MLVRLPRAAVAALFWLFLLLSFLRFSSLFQLLPEYRALLLFFPLLEPLLVLLLRVFVGSRPILEFCACRVFPPLESLLVRSFRVLVAAWLALEVAEFARMAFFF